MSYQVIARKYRPQVFEEVVGQRLITDTLKNAILRERVAHGLSSRAREGWGEPPPPAFLPRPSTAPKARR